MKRKIEIFFILIIITILFSCGKSSSQKSDLSKTNSTSGLDSCNNPDGNINCCFAEMPVELTNIMKIAEDIEPGERIIISGRILKQDSITPYPNAVIYAYHTDNNGYYSKKGNETGIQKWHGHLHGWCKTDDKGYYEIHTIKPARYPENLFPAHIHSAIKLPDDSQPVFINDFVFSDDDLVNEKYLNGLKEEGGTGVVELKKSDGILKGTRDIILK